MRKEKKILFLVIAIMVVLSAILSVRAFAADDDVITITTNSSSSDTSDSSATTDDSDTSDSDTGVVTTTTTTDTSDTSSTYTTTTTTSDTSTTETESESSNIPYTGTENYTVGICVICLIVLSSIFAFKKVREYKF